MQVGITEEDTILENRGRLTNIAAAIREVTNSAEQEKTYSVSSMPDAIRNIPVSYAKETTAKDGEILKGFRAGINRGSLDAPQLEIIEGSYDLTREFLGRDLNPHLAGLLPSTNKLTSAIDSFLGTQTPSGDISLDTSLPIGDQFRKGITQTASRIEDLNKKINEKRNSFINTEGYSYSGIQDKLFSGLNFYEFEDSGHPTFYLEEGEYNPVTVTFLAASINNCCHYAPEGTPNQAKNYNRVLPISSTNSPLLQKAAVPQSTGSAAKGSLEEQLGIFKEISGGLPAQTETLIKIPAGEYLVHAQSLLDTPSNSKPQRGFSVWVGENITDVGHFIEFSKGDSIKTLTLQVPSFVCCVMKKECAIPAGTDFNGTVSFAQLKPHIPLQGGEV